MSSNTRNTPRNTPPTRETTEQQLLNLAMRAGRLSVSVYGINRKEGFEAMAALEKAHPHMGVALREAYGFGAEDQAERRAACGGDEGYDADGNRI